MPRTRVPRLAAAVDRLVEAARSQPGEVGGDVLRAGQDDELGIVEIGRVPRPDDLRDLLQRLELVEVRGGRVAHDRDPRRAGSTAVEPPRRPRREGRARRTAADRRTPCRWRARGLRARDARRRLRRRGTCSGRIRSEASSVLVGHERPGAVEVRERAAAVDVRDEDDGRSRGVRRAHVRRDRWTRRLVSAGLPAPSSRTSSNSASSSCSACSATGQSDGGRSRQAVRLSSWSTRPSTTTWLRSSASGLTRIGFMRTSGSTPAASACRYCAAPISPPSTTRALFDMFCALNGATRTPRRGTLARAR